MGWSIDAITLSVAANWRRNVVPGRYAAVTNSASFLRVSTARSLTSTRPQMSNAGGTAGRVLMPRNAAGACDSTAL